MAQSKSSNRMADDAKQFGQDVKQAAQGVQEAVMEKVADVAESAKQLGSQAACAAQEQYESMRDSAEEYIQQGSEKAMRMERQLQQRIVEKPLQSIMIAAGVGFVLGVIMCRR